MRIKQTEQKEIGRIKLSNTRELVAPIVGGEKLDSRVCGWAATNAKDG